MIIFFSTLKIGNDLYYVTILGKFVIYLRIENIQNAHLVHHFFMLLTYSIITKKYLLLYLDLKVKLGSSVIIVEI